MSSTDIFLISSFGFKNKFANIDLTLYNFPSIKIAFSYLIGLSIYGSVTLLLKSFIKYRGVNNWIDILNTLLNCLNVEACNQEFQQNILNLLSFIFEKLHEVKNKKTQDKVNF